MNLNKAFIIGNLTRDPEMRTLPSGTPVASFGMATNRMWTTPQGEKKQEAQFHNIVAFGKYAEIIKQYMKKGSLAFIEGRLQTRNWEAQDGAKRSRTEIVVEKLQMGPRLGGAGGDGTNYGAKASQPAAEPVETLDTIEYPEENNNPNDIPF